MIRKKVLKISEEFGIPLEFWGKFLQGTAGPEWLIGGTYIGSKPEEGYSLHKGQTTHMDGKENCLVQQVLKVEYWEWYLESYFGSFSHGT